MNEEKRYSIFEHSLPEVVLKNPRLIFLIYWSHWLLHSRVRVSKKLIKKYLVKSAPSKFIDLGCGEGNILLPLSRKYPKCEFVGVDQNKALVDFINGYAQNYSPNLKAIKNDLNSIAIEGQFDFCSCIAVLQYLRNEDHLLDQIKKSLKKNGVFVFNVPLKNSNSSRRKGYDDFHGVYNEYSLLRIEELLKEKGFSIEEKKATNGRIGTFANTITNWSIDKIQEKGVLLKLLHTIIFIFMLFPFIIVLNILNDILPKKSVSGIVIAARKN